MLRDVMSKLVQSDDPDLSARQLAVLMACYMEAEPQTVRGLAAALKISKPAVTRAIDRLEKLTFAVRNPDPTDGRSIIVGTTSTGRAYLRTIKRALATAAKKHDVVFTTA